MSKRSKQRQGANKQGRSKLPWKRGKKQEVLPVDNSRITSQILADYKREMQKVVDYTNLRIDEQLKTHTMSSELYDFLDEDFNKRFSISQLTSPDEIKAYMTQVRTVLSSIDQGSQKASIDTAIMEAEAYRGQFGNQHRGLYIGEDNKMHVRHFNLNDVIDSEGKIIRHAVDPEIASKAFSAYRRVEKGYAGVIGRQGQELMFGSENLIILLYDFYSKNPGADYDFTRKGDTYDALDYITPILEHWIDERLMELEGINLNFQSASDIITSWEDRMNRRYF